MNTEYIKYLADKLSFPDEAKISLIADSAKINASVKASVLLDDALKAYENSDYAYESIKYRFDGIAESSGVHKYAAAMLILMLACEKLEKKYAEAGYTDEMFVNSMTDLRCKLVEYHNSYGFWGTDSAWHTRFYRMTCFGLGRFQFEKREFKNKCSGIAGNFVKEGDTVLNFHIPSTGESLTEEIRFASYKKAKEFFFPNSDKPTPFVCHSWLLWPGYEECLKNNKNTMAFRHDFTIVDASESQRFSDGWRVFGPKAWGDVSEWPRDTSMRRALAEYTEQGGTHGSGYGLFFFDGEKIVK